MWGVGGPGPRGGRGGHHPLISPGTRQVRELTLVTAAMGWPSGHLPSTVPTATPGLHPAGVSGPLQGLGLPTGLPTRAGDRQAAPCSGKTVGLGKLRTFPKHAQCWGESLACGSPPHSLPDSCLLMSGPACPAQEGKGQGLTVPGLRH